MLAHLRAETHPYLQRGYLAPAGADGAGGHPLTNESIRSRIAAAKARLGGAAP
jgi:hypothetical protein